MSTPLPDDAGQFETRPFRVALVVASLVVGCVSAAPRQSGPFHECSETYKRGIFTDDVLRCLPGLQEQLRGPLCRATVNMHPQLMALGFGIGTEVYGQTVRDPRLGMALEPGPYLSWKIRSCLDVSGMSSTPMTAPQAAGLFEEVYRSLPKSLYGPWRDCVESFDINTPEPKRGLARLFAPTGRGLRCALIGSHDLSGEDETVRFAAAYFSENWFDFATSLRRDLEVEGLDCGDRVWRKGTRIPLHGRVLECRRRDRSAVKVRLQTGVGSCERQLPELTEVPWQSLCAER